MKMKENAQKKKREIEDAKIRKTGTVKQCEGPEEKEEEEGKRGEDSK